jgi:GH35 family endo-1,4-beta-xylanase
MSTGWALGFATVAYTAIAAELLSEPHWATQTLDSPDLRVTPMVGSPVPALRIDILRASQPFYKRQIGWPLVKGVEDGHRVAVSVRLRSPTANPARLTLEGSRPPYEGVAEVLLPRIPDTWTHVALTQTVSRAWPPGTLTVRLQVGHQTGVVELANLAITDLGPDPAWVAARQAVQPEEVQRRIREIRNVNLRVRVRDARGSPRPGATVEVQQVRHTFLFGCNFFLFQDNNTEPWQLDYRRHFTNLFNYATLPFYWGAFEPQPGREQHQRLESTARWCAEHGVATKGHPLVWHEVWPRWAPATRDAARALLEQRVKRVILHYQPWIRYWDVWNEATAALNERFKTTGVADWIRQDGAARAVAEAFRWARTVASQDTVLLYNDFNVSTANENLLRELGNLGQMPDAIGLQSHMHGTPWPLSKVWDVAERFAKFGCPIHFTEVTVTSGGPRPRPWNHVPYQPNEWPTTPDGERTQAEYVESFYRLLVSHPAVEAITWWDLSDRNAWQRAPAGLLRQDMSPKPAYERLHRWIRQEWWTRTNVVTSADGSVTVRVWRAEHKIVAHLGSAQARSTLRIPQRGPRELTVDLQVPAGE